MSIGYLPIEAAKKRAREIATFSEHPDNWYYPGETTIPGDCEEHVMLSTSMRAVFCWAVIRDSAKDSNDKCEVRRHLSISIRNNAFPQPSIVWTLAHYFGFTNAVVHKASGLVNEPARNWAFTTDPNEGCVVVQEVVEKAAYYPPKVRG